MKETVNRITLVEDDDSIGRLLKQLLEGEEYIVTWVTNGFSAIEQITSSQPDLVVLDLGLPKVDGLEVCRRVRPAFENSILMLTAHADELNEITALSVGVDDFLDKPVRPQILLARIRALLRRQQRNSSQRIELGGLVVDRSRRTADWAEASIEISEAEFEVLWLLAVQAGKPLSRDEIFWRLRGKPYDGVDRAMDMRISGLRTALKNAGAPDLIRTVRHKGYVLAEAGGAE